MWKDHVHNCASCHLSDVDCQIDPFSIIVPIGFHFMLCGQFTRVAIMLVSSVLKGSTYGILYTTFEQSTSLKMVFLSLHLSRSSFFRSHNKISLNIFFHGDSNLVEDLKDCN